MDNQNSTELDQNMDLVVSLFQYYVEGVGILTIGTVGIVINLVALYILMKKQVKLQT